MSLGAVTFYVWCGIVVGLLVAQFVHVRRSVRR